jgi:hypothetical protein
VSASGFRALVDEARRVGFAVHGDAQPESAGPLAVSGMLAEQLVKELAAGAEPGRVVVGGTESVGRAEVLVRIVAGDPTPEDEELVSSADAHGVPVVMVQLWPQADWTRPFVLTPFVVECKAGQGFPIRLIADRIVDATERDAALASDIPVLAEASRHGAVRSTVVRAGLIGLLGSRSGASRPLLALEQVQLVSRLRNVSGAAGDDELRIRAAGAGAVLASSFAFRHVARSLRTVLPTPVANAAVAVAGTWALAKAAEIAGAKLADR